MKVEKSDVLAFTISDAERLDPVRVMIENYEPGKGRITVTCYGQAWTGAWFAMGGDTVQEFIKRVSNDYLIGCLAPRLESSVDDDNDANLEFVKSQIIKLRREQEIDKGGAREMWTEAENAEDVKANCCDFIVGDKLLKLFGDDPWYAGWPSVPNPKYQYLERIIEAVRGGLAELERQMKSFRHCLPSFHESLSRWRSKLRRMKVAQHDSRNHRSGQRACAAAHRHGDRSAPHQPQRRIS